MFRVGSGTDKDRDLAAWGWAVVLALPAFVPLVAHYVGFVRTGLEATGFLVYDAPYYVANAREHFDAGRFTPLYSNPFSFDYASPRIYIQPFILLLGVLVRLTDVSPGWVFSFVGIATALGCARVAVSLFNQFGDRNAPGGGLALTSFFWGGGIVALAAAAVAIVATAPGTSLIGFDAGRWWRLVEYWDPAAGWWFLNFGRNLVLPTEALYHALFFGAIVLILARRFLAAAAVMAVLSVSHPFTGIQLIAIVSAWTALELVLTRTRVVSVWFLGACAALLLAHCAYYLWFLPRFPEHKQLQSQWTLAWTLSLTQSLLAYGPVAAIAAWRMRTWSRFRDVVSEWPNRLLLVWLGVSLALEHHELFLPQPIQPLHFTRGYSWIALFLLGLPSLTALFRRVSRKSQPRTAGLAALVLVVLLVDNVAWLGAVTTQGLRIDAGRTMSGERVRLGYGLSRDQKELLDWMNEEASRAPVVVSEDFELSYLTTVYTPLRAWRSHVHNTPWTRRRLAELSSFFATGDVVDTWRTMPLLIVFRRPNVWRERVQGFGDAATELAFENATYTVVRTHAALRVGVP